MNLDQFIAEARTRRLANLYISEPGFKSLYVRYTRRWIAGVEYYPVLDLAVLEASSPNKGAFTRLLEKVITEYPELHVYIECVMSVRFANKLEKLGFQKLESYTADISPSFFLKAKNNL